MGNVLVVEAELHELTSALTGLSRLRHFYFSQAKNMRYPSDNLSETQGRIGCIVKAKSLYYYQERGDDSLVTYPLS